MFGNCQQLHLGKNLVVNIQHKNLSVLTRLILASTKPNAWILDPFAGSSTTGIAANLANRRFLGIDQEEEFLTISKNRKIEIENPKTSATYRQKMVASMTKKNLNYSLSKNQRAEYKTELNLENKRGDRLTAVAVAQLLF
jgi:site-specific DNA-methyltransferase (adenine-specific)